MWPSQFISKFSGFKSLYIIFYLWRKLIADKISEVYNNATSCENHPSCLSLLKTSPPEAKFNNKYVLLSVKNVL